MPLSKSRANAVGVLLEDAERATYGAYETAHQARLQLIGSTDPISRRLIEEAYSLEEALLGQVFAIRALRRHSADSTPIPVPARTLKVVDDSEMPDGRPPVKWS